MRDKNMKDKERARRDREKRVSRAATVNTGKNAHIPGEDQFSRVSQSKNQSYTGVYVHLGTGDYSSCVLRGYESSTKEMSLFEMFRTKFRSR